MDGFGFVAFSWDRSKRVEEKLVLNPCRLSFSHCASEICLSNKLSASESLDIKPSNGVGPGKEASRRWSSNATELTRQMFCESSAVLIGELSTSETVSHRGSWGHGSKRWSSRMAGKSVGSSWRVLLRRARFPSDLASISMARSFLRPLDPARERGFDTRGLLANVLPRSESPCLSTSTTLTGSHSIGESVDSKSGVEFMDLVVIIGNVLGALVAELGPR